MKISGNIVDVIHRKIYPGIVEIKEGVIQNIIPTETSDDVYILPGLVDAHVHIESSMTVPSRFAHMVVPRGTVAVVSDPHEIANVNGIGGVEFMIQDAENVPLKCFFGVPSCVPATSFETSGSQITAADVDVLFQKGGWFLAEMMNFPGVINDDPEVIAKIDLAKKKKKRIDGHAPGLKGDDLKKYVQAGITTDHECSTLEEAIEKIKLGMVIQIREGSAARNFDALWSLIQDYPDQVMLCTDDSHPDLICQDGHIDRLIRRGLQKGLSIFDLYKAALINPVSHYNLPVGMMQKGDRADLIVVDNFDDFNVLQTLIDGKVVAQKGKAKFNLLPVSPINAFNCEKITTAQLEIRLPAEYAALRVMDAYDGELLTDQYLWKPQCQSGELLTSDISEDILKIVVVNRYKRSEPAVGFIRNFGIKKGAIAGSIAHDSHNIIAIGCDDAAIVNVINAIIDEKGGMAAFNGHQINLIPLPVAGLMSVEKGAKIAQQYAALNVFVKEMGTKMKSPFMTLAFMSLLVIPSLKIGDQGLFDVNTFSFTDLFVRSDN